MNDMPSTLPIDKIGLNDFVRSFDFADGPYGRDLMGDRAWTALWT